MNLGEFRKFTKHMPNEIELILWNSRSEWYGCNKIQKKNWFIEQNLLVLQFVDKTDDPDHRKHFRQDWQAYEDWEERKQKNPRSIPWGWK